jgi:hypothetical protein
VSAAAALEEPPALGLVRPGGAAPNAIAAPMRAAAASRGVPVRPAMEVAAAGTATPVAATATAPPGAAMMAVEWLAPKGSAAATAASASRVFLLRLPGGRHRRWVLGLVEATERAAALAPA